MKGSDSTATLFIDVGVIIKSRMQNVIALPFSQCQTLGFVAGQQSPGMQDIARHFKIRAPSATFLVEELVRGGLLARKANSADRRKVELELTGKGKKMFKQIEEKRNAILHELFGSLNESDRKELDRILGAIIKNAN